MADDDNRTAVFIDGTDALAYVLIRPNANGSGVVIEAGADGITQQEAARVLRHVADRWDTP